MTEKHVTDNADTPPMTSQRVPTRLGRLLTLSAIVAVLLYVLVCVVTWSASDPGWSRVGPEGVAVHNAGGPFGAWLADVLHQLFGYGAWLVPALLGTTVWMALSPAIDITRQHHKWIPTLRLIGLVGLMVGASGMLHVRLPLREVSLAGGGLGMLVGKTLQNSFGSMGCNLFLLILLLASITLATGLSWFWLMEKIGQGVLAATSRLQQHKQAWQQYRQRRAIQKQRAQNKKKTESQTEETVTLPPVALTLPDRIEPHLSGDIPERLVPHPGVPMEKGGKAVRREPVLSSYPSSPAVAEDTVIPAVAPFTPFAQFTQTPAAPVLPTLSLLDKPKPQPSGYDEHTLETLSRKIEFKLKEFRIDCRVVDAYLGPVITRFEIEPAPGVKVSQINSLDKDIARALSVPSVRVVDIIPGKSVIGLEIPNISRALICLSELLRSQAYQNADSVLTLALGQSTSGEPVIADLARMPHLLMAGTTGSGKSVAVNAMVLSLLFKATPKELRLLMIDPKMLELNVYEGIGHLLAPVVTDMEKAANGLRWCVTEMERRYKLMSASGVRNLDGFNKKVNDAIASGQPLLDPLFMPQSAHDGMPRALEPMPYIVIFIDEFSDLMMIAGKKVEELIARLAQKARAAGIHLIMATQRPSVDVITGLIKANIPSRIAFQVSSKIDSRIILDQSGAETLLGHGDMLYLPPGTALPERVHGAFVSDEEVHRLVNQIKSSSGANYIEGVLDDLPDVNNAANNTNTTAENENDTLYEKAVQIVAESRRASSANLQRRLKIGAVRAGRLLEVMENAGIVSRPDDNGERSVLAAPPVRLRGLI